MGTYRRLDRSAKESTLPLVQSAWVLRSSVRKFPEGRVAAVSEQAGEGPTQAEEVGGVHAVGVQRFLKAFELGRVVRGRLVHHYPGYSRGTSN